MLPRWTPSMMMSGEPKPRISMLVLNWPGSAVFWTTRRPETLPVSMFRTFSFFVVMISLLETAETAPERVVFFWTA